LNDTGNIVYINKMFQLTKRVRKFPPKTFCEVDFRSLIAEWGTIGHGLALTLPSNIRLAWKIHFSDKTCSCGISNWRKKFHDLSTRTPSKSKLKLTKKGMRLSWPWLRLSRNSSSRLRWRGWRF